MAATVASTSLPTFVDWRRDPKVVAWRDRVAKARDVQISAARLELETRQAREVAEHRLGGLQARFSTGDASVTIGMLAKAKGDLLAAQEAERAASATTSQTGDVLSPDIVKQIRADTLAAQERLAHELSRHQLALVAEVEDQARALLTRLEALGRVTTFALGAFTGGGHPLDDEVLHGPDRFAKFLPVPDRVVVSELKLWLSRLERVRALAAGRS